MDGYEWDGKRWVPQAGGPGVGWAQQQPPAMPAGTFAPLPSAIAFTEPRYGYGLTRQTSDDLQFIARYAKVIIILGLILAALALVAQLITLLGLLGLAGSLIHR